MLNESAETKERVNDLLYHFKNLDLGWTSDGRIVKIFKLSKYAEKKIEWYLKPQNFKCHYTLIKDLNRLLYDQNKH